MSARGAGRAPACQDLHRPSHSAGPVLAAQGMERVEEKPFLLQLLSWLQTLVSVACAVAAGPFYAGLFLSRATVLDKLFFLEALTVETNRQVPGLFLNIFRD